MTILQMPIHGSLHLIDDHAIFIMEESGSQFYLAFSLLQQRSEREIFPESLLDDWGHEINSLDLYKWIQEHGQDFPRAEIFGYDWNGEDIQLFIREIDLIGKYPCYLYHDLSQNVDEGVNLAVIAVSDRQVDHPKEIPGKSLFEFPLGNARVRWLLVNPDDLTKLSTITFS